jgi:1-deoxy-D-xylulose-5-phosphate reductoisomerase
MRSGGTAPAALNAANEVAVAEFLAGRIRFPQIATTVDRVMQKWEGWEPRDLDCVIQADLRARAMAVDAVAACQRVAL